FDLIVSNPPYIALNEWAGLDRDVARFDPRIALTDEGDGLDAYRVITKGAPGRLAAGGVLCVEIGWTQGADVTALFQQAGFLEVGVIKDMAGRDRCVMGRRPA
ncbi:MAG: peptide chain release factor N(5)-glutamine methyltransferase, partial [Pseudomonadota bacterium]